MTVDVIDLLEMIDVAKKYLTRVSIASNRSSLKGLRRWSKAFASKARGRCLRRPASSAMPSFSSICGSVSVSLRTTEEQTAEGAFVI
jgi:hypothetical protein